MKKIFLVLGLTLLLTGCQQTTRTINITPTEFNTETQTEDNKIETLSKDELDKTLTSIKNRLNGNVSVNTMEDYYNLKKDIENYCESVINNKDITDVEERLLGLQKEINNSTWKWMDVDDDGVTDLTEILVTNTSPISGSTGQTDRLDSKVKGDYNYILYIKEGSLVTVQPELSKYFLSGIEDGKIKTKDGEYLEIKTSIFAEEMKSMELIAEICKTNLNGAVCFPITFRLTGTTEMNITGSALYHHKEHPDKGDSVIGYVYNGNSVTDSYLSRTPISSETTNRLFTNRQYYLLFSESK